MATVAGGADPRSDRGRPFLPFAAPDITQAEIDEVVDTLRSGWITTGPKARRFEQDFAAALGGGVECVAVNSATAGLHLALEAIGIRPGDRVVVPTHTFTATAEVVRYLDADPIFVDIDPATYCIDPDATAAAIDRSTRAILPVHYAGLACAMDRLAEVAAAHGARVVEDAAHAFPTRWNGRLVGTLDTDATVFSFYANKTLACGEGGMVVTRDPAIARRCRVMRLHGIDRDAFDRFVATRPSWYYEVVAPGYKYNLTDIAAALGLQQLRRMPELVARRETLARRYLDELQDLPLRLPPQPGPGGSHAWHLFVVQLEEAASVDRDAAISSLYDVGIGCSVHYVPLHLQPYWRDRYRLEPSMFPNSQRLYERGFSIPLYSRMSDDDQTRVIEALRRVLLRR